MTKKIDDGGPAHPGKRVEKIGVDYSGGTMQTVYGDVDYPGMSLRDWIAGQALAGMLAMPEHANGNFHNNCGEPFIGPARYAYRMADAMIAAREGGA